MSVFVFGAEHEFSTVISGGKVLGLGELDIPLIQSSRIMIYVYWKGAWEAKASLFSVSAGVLWDRTA